MAGEEVAFQSLEESKGGTYKSPALSGFILNILNIFSQTLNTDVIYLSATLRTEKTHFCRVLFARQRERIIDLFYINDTFVEDSTKSKARKNNQPQDGVFVSELATSVYGKISGVVKNIYPPSVYTADQLDT